MFPKDSPDSIHIPPPRKFLEKLCKHFPNGLPPGELPPPPFVDTFSVMTGEFAAKSLVSKQSCFTAPWSIEFPGLFSVFCIVQHGSCYAKIVDSNDSIHLKEGDLIIFPHPKNHILCDSLTTPPVSILKLLSDKLPKGPPEIHYGGGGIETKVILGRLHFENEQSLALIHALPDMLHLSSESPNKEYWLDLILQLIDEEMSQELDGRFAIINHLVMVIFIKAIRNCLSEFSVLPGTSLAALKDPDINAALGLIHGHPSMEWSVQRLADEVHMSRSVFAERFTKVVGKTPMAYLLEFRMNKAATMLRKSQKSIKEISINVGYKTDSAFSTAFKRWSGISPGAYRQQ